MLDNGERRRAGASNDRARLVSRRKFLAATGGGAAVSMAGCLGGGGGGSGVTIGGVYLLSGLAEALGAGSAATAEVAVEAINEEGGIMGEDVELIIRDHGDDPQGQLQSLVQAEGADVLLGMTSSGVTLNSGPTVEQLGVPWTLTDIGTPYVTEPNEEKYGDFYGGDGKAAGLPNVFRTNSNTSHMTYAIAKYISENYDSPRIANMGPDYAYGQQCWDYVQAYMDGLGVDYEVTASEFPELGATNMTPQINSVLSSDPDLLFTSFWANDTVTFTNQAAEQGLFDQVEDVFDTIGADPNNFDALGDTMPEGMHYSGWYWPGAYDTEADEQFIERFRNAYENDSEVLAYPPFTGGSTWAAVHIYKQAIEAAGSTNPDDIISEMEGLTYENDPRGSITIDAETHQATANCVIGESSFDADVPYDGAGQVNTQTYSLDRDTALDLLEGSDLPPGL
ncbi:ABC transporter substrate-binding protein [Halorientalis regularis]|jgi:ABC-type branched-subunit amino acid transport system substrate-binding protein|uniref:Amino acid/amide ABC transporter substrate-binding protein, HAAT family n=1 Tax=Halorientalis regularis TaxID=660518 RepID=A0A1G7P6V9_9EURY|nr:ABC transporter substrate-binding protein [Halorientalis regularis]SDF82066.1 amino acid/amide ABC transporter substrate-binding protein, HAAT family [Halorientalis regularis]